MNSRGSFMIYNWTEREKIVYNAASFEGKIISKNGYTHERKVNASDGLLMISDRVNKPYSIHFHTPCEVSIDGNRALLSLDGKTLCTIQSDGAISVNESERSLYYLAETKTCCLSVSADADCEINTKISILAV